MKNTALMLTQYERYGSIGNDEYIEYFIDEELEVDENTLRLEHNKYAYSVKFNVPITETEKGYMIEGEETEIIIFFT